MGRHINKKLTYSLSIIILSFFFCFFLTPFESSLTNVGAQSTTEISLSNCGANPVTKLNPDPSIRVNVRVPANHANTAFELFLDDSEGTRIETTQTCYKEGGVATTTPTQTAHFFEIPKGTYRVCNEAMCTLNFQHGYTPDPTTIVEFEIKPEHLGDSDPNNQVRVTLKINVPRSGKNTTYGPYKLELLDNTGEIVKSAETTVKELPDGGIATSYNLLADFDDVAAGTGYKVCTAGSSAICSVEFEKQDNVQTSVTIEISEDKLAGLASGASASTGSPPTCGSVITTGIGWIVCPVISTLTALNDSMWSFVENLLFVNPISKSNDGVYKGWVTIRNISNVFFVIAFLVIIFSQLSGFGISNYGVKKLLPRIIVVAIAINLSFIVMQVAIDATNIIGKGLYDAIYASSPTPTIGWADALKLVLEGSGIALGAGAAALVILGPEAALLALLPILLSALVSFLAAALTLIFRQAIIPILAMIAPLAFIANLLPNTEQWFKKWSKLLLNMLMLYPMAALVFAGARFASSAIIGEAVKQGDTFNMIIGLIVLSLPLFSLPFLSRQGAPMLAKVSGALGNLGKRITSPIDNFSKEVAKNARVRSDNAAMNAENPGVFRRARRGVLQYRARRNAVNQNQQRELNRSQTDYVAGEVLNENSNLAQQMAAGSGSGADSRAKASATKAQDDIFKSEKEAEAILQRGMARGALKLTARGGAGITEAQQAAAFEEIMKTGNLEERQEMLSTLTPDTSQRIRSIAEAGYYARGDHKIFGPQLGDAIKAGSKATGEGEGRNLSIEEALLAEFDSKMIKGSFSASALASDKDVAKKVASQFTGLSEDAKSNLAKQAQTALAMPTAQDLDAEHRASLQAMIDGANPTRSGLVDKRGNPL